MTSFLFCYTLLAVPPLITVDDAPDFRYHPQMLDVLKKHRTKAIFFILGAMLERRKNQDLLRRIVREGHQLGNHLYTHLSACRTTRTRAGHYHAALGASGVRRELRRTERALFRVLRKRPALHYWRSPFGHYCRSAWNAARVAGYRHLGWHITSAAPISTIIRMISHRHPHQTIVLFHFDYKKLDNLLTAYRKVNTHQN